MQTILNNTDLVGTFWFFRKIVHHRCCSWQLAIRLVLLFIVLAFPASIWQRKALKMQPRCAQQPDCTYHAYRKYTGNSWVRDTSL